MYLARQRQNGRTCLSLMESVYDRKTGKRPKRRLKSFGNEETLREKNKELLAEIERKYGSAGERAETQRNEVMQRLKTLGEFEGLAGRPGKFPELNASLLLRRLWDDVLGLPRFIGCRLKSEKSCIEFPVSDIAFYLAALKLMDPMSRLGALEAAPGWLCCGAGGCTDDDFCSCLS
jgi:hypothetical protein